MKKVLSASVLALASLSFATAANAQQTKTGNTNLHVVITDALDFTVNNTDVTLTFASAADYQSGVTSLQNNHLTVTTNRPYDLELQAAATTLAGTGGNLQTINASTVTVEIDDPVAQALGGTATTISALSDQKQKLLASATATSNKGINVKYSIPSSVSQTAEILGKAADTYTTLLTYTVTQK